MSLPGACLPSYDGNGLAGVLPSVLATLAGSTPAPRPLPPARNAVVVLVDGLGWEQLRARSGHAPFLRRVLADDDAATAVPLTAGFPSTTATSMGSFGTGRPPGQHGLVGYQVRAPGRASLFNELTWVDGPDSVQWQPDPTIFEKAVSAGVVPWMFGPTHFDGSGLTKAVLRGARFTGAGGKGHSTAEDLSTLVDGVLHAVRASREPLLAYLYWGEVDKAGHVHGCASWQWGDEVEALDRELRRLWESLPNGTSLTVTADHGMVDVPEDARIDVAHEPTLSEGVALVGGELRAPIVYCRIGAEDDVLAAWRSRLESLAWVLSRAEAIEAGLYGEVHDRVLPRLGEVLVAMHAPAGVFDSRLVSRRVSSLVGQHGSLTTAEQLVPFVHLPAR